MGKEACVYDDDLINDICWIDGIDTVDWDELSELYRVAPLGNKPPAALRTVFGNSMFVRFAYSDGRLVAAGRVLADGIDCAYIGDVAVHPDHQGRGLGKSVVRQLIEAAEGHRKIILNARPSTEGFYAGLGFLPMNTAMAVWNDPDAAIQSGLLRRAS